MPKPSRWTVEKRYEIVMEVIKGKEPIAAIARKYQVSDAVILSQMARAVLRRRQSGAEFRKWRISVAESRRGPTATDRGTGEGHRTAGGRDPFFKKAVEDVKPSWSAVETARVEEGIKVDTAVQNSLR